MHKHTFPQVGSQSSLRALACGDSEIAWQAKKRAMMGTRQMLMAALPGQCPFTEP